MRVLEWARYRAVIAIVAVCLAPAVSGALRAQLPDNEFRWDNDAFRFPKGWRDSDFGYTNGFRLTSSVESPRWLTNSLPSNLRSGCADISLRCHGFKVYGGQDIYTPRDQRTATVVRGDRPYAGLLYAG
ncbi:MAG TPA: lipid A-modifier LpxR family protein, partial [Gemmatimonadaceae bacterium]|nr:lipid A-modifier LpxR family protein [Gemmatimonadaceae bacterium]